VKSITNTANVKQMNTALIKTVLKAMPGNTKANIALATGLSHATCNTILNELVTTGEVLEMEKENSNGGRPAQQYQFNGDYAHVICLYIDNENRNPVIKYALINLLGNILKEKSIKKDTVDYDTLEELIGELLQDYQKVKTIGIGIPGVVLKHTVISFCDIKALVGCHLAERLQSKFGVNVILENDMNLTALGFYQAQNYEEDTSIAVLTFIKDNLPGAGIIVDGHIVRGYSNFAGEVSFLPFDCTRKQQFQLLRTRDGVLNFTTKSLCSIIAVINPQTIILTGTLLSEDMLEEIICCCSNIIPKEHMPHIFLQETVHEYYIRGLLEMSLESLTYPLKMIQKRI